MVSRRTIRTARPPSATRDGVDPAQVEEDVNLGAVQAHVRARPGVEQEEPAVQEEDAGGWAADRYRHLGGDIALGQLVDEQVIDSLRSVPAGGEAVAPAPAARIAVGPTPDVVRAARSGGTSPDI